MISAIDVLNLRMPDVLTKTKVIFVFVDDFLR